MCSQFKSYENEIPDSRTNISPVKKMTYLFGEGLASDHKRLRIRDLCKELEMVAYESRRDLQQRQSFVG
jgi:hypothetical protein